MARRRRGARGRHERPRGRALARGGPAPHHPRRQGPGVGRRRRARHGRAGLPLLHQRRQGRSSRRGDRLDGLHLHLPLPAAGRRRRPAPLHRGGPRPGCHRQAPPDRDDERLQGGPRTPEPARGAPPGLRGLHPGPPRAPPDRLPPVQDRLQAPPALTLPHRAPAARPPASLRERLGGLRRVPPQPADLPDPGGHLAPRRRRSGDPGQPGPGDRGRGRPGLRTRRRCAPGSACGRRPGHRRYGWDRARPGVARSGPARRRDGAAVAARGGTPPGRALPGPVQRPHCPPTRAPGRHPSG